MYARGQGVVLNEPSVVALNTNTNELLAVGQAALNMNSTWGISLAEAGDPIFPISSAEWEVAGSGVTPSLCAVATCNMT